MINNFPNLKSVFPEPPILSYCRNQNLHNLLVRSSFNRPPPCHTASNSSSCQKSRCKLCPSMSNSNSILSRQSEKNMLYIRRAMHYHKHYLYNVIYRCLRSVWRIATVLLIPLFITSKGYFCFSIMSFNSSKFLFLACLFSTIVQMRLAKQNGILTLQCFRCADEDGKYLLVSVALVYRSIQILLSSLRINTSRKGTISLLCCIVNCIFGCIEFKML